jgi:tetratricopeptide (TPR) repeat protein
MKMMASWVLKSLYGEDAKSMKKLLLLAFLAPLFVAASDVAAKPDATKFEGGPKENVEDKQVPKSESRLPVDDLKFSILMKTVRKSNEVTDHLAKMESFRKGAEESLDELLKSNPKDLELNLRYAELQLQRARDLEQFSLELMLGGDGAKAHELQEQSYILYAKGLKHYLANLKRLKGHPLEGEIYLGMARSMKSLSKNKEALELLKDIEGRSYNKKTNFGLALTRGELEFTLGNAAAAKSSYEEALKYVAKPSNEEMYLNYKRAWSLYNLKKAKAAISELKKVVEVNKDKLALAQEAAQDYLVFLADLDMKYVEKTEGGLPGVYKYLSRYSKTAEIDRGFENLAETYWANGRRDDAKRALDFLINHDPNSPRNSERAMSIVKYDHDLADAKVLSARYVWLLRNFGPHSTWYRRQDKRVDVQQNSDVAIEESLRNYAVRLHKESMSETSLPRKAMLEATAASLYDLHLQNFKDLPRIHYYRAEIFRRTKDYENSARQYDDFNRALSAMPAESIQEFDQKLQRETSFGAVEMWAKAIDKKPKLTDLMVKSCDNFVENYPDDPRAPTVALDAARVEYKMGHSEIALGRLQKIIQRYPKLQEAVEAVHAGLDILNKLGDYANLSEYARKWRDQADQWAPEKKKEELRTEVGKVLYKSEAKACEDLAKRKNKKLEAALCFRRVADNNQETEIAPKSLALAYDLFKEFGDPYAALETLEILVRRYPNSPQALPAFSKLAEGFERNFQFAKSADIYERLLTRKDAPNRKQVIVRLASLYQGLGEEEKLDKLLLAPDAGQDLKNEVFTRRLKSKHGELLEQERIFGYEKGHFVSKSAQAIYVELKKFETEEKLPRPFQFELRRIEGHFLESAGSVQQAAELWAAELKAFYKIPTKTPELWESAARMRLSQGSHLRSLFKAADIASNQQKKISLFQKIEAWNTEVIGMNSPAVALETLWLTAKIYREFAAELKSKESTVKMGEDMAAKAKLVTQALARHAQNWGLISPLLLSTLKDLRAARGEKVEGDVQINFPWPELPRGLDMAVERRSLPEWKTNLEDLHTMLVASKDRKEQRNLAFIALTKGNSINKSQLNGWEELLTDKDEVQSRIEATIEDHQNEKAEMILAQYEAVYGDDLFSAIALSRLDVNRREYSGGYHRAIALFDRSEFAAKYYAIGWKSLFDELIEGDLTESFRDEAFSVLQSLAKQNWEKELLATLCLKTTINCSGEYVGTALLNLLQHNRADAPSDFLDHRSLWRIERDFLSAAIKNLSKYVRHTDQVEILKSGLAKLRTLSDGAVDSKAQRRAVDVAQDAIRIVEGRIIAKEAD